MNPRLALVAILAVAFAIELALAAGGFLAPTATAAAFKLTATPDTLFLAHVVAWLLLFVALVCGAALVLVRRGDPAGWLLANLLGWWWVAIGLALAAGYGRFENLLLDTFKGGLIVAAAWRSRPRK